ncbi:IS3 family transposase [Streptomyces sp. NPDC001100]
MIAAPRTAPHGCTCRNRFGNRCWAWRLRGAGQKINAAPVIAPLFYRLDALADRPVSPSSHPHAARMLPPALPNIDFPISVNALAGNLWMLIKTECIRGRVFATRAEVHLALFEYIDGFYNSRRIQKRLGSLNPVEFEEKHYADQAPAKRTNLKPRQPTLTS